MLIPNGVGLLGLWSDVRTFHLVFGHPAPTAPLPQLPDAAARRGEWICREVAELVEATDIVGQADAYIDIIYFAVGGLVELGVQPHELWNIVHRANMDKLWPDGKPRVGNDPTDLETYGRVQKPPAWKPPEPLLMAEVQRQISAALGLRA